MAFQTIVRTCNPIRVHTFSWTIENITRIPEKVSGTPFFPIPNRLKTFHFDLSVKEFDDNSSTKCRFVVYLNIQASDQTFNLVYDVTLCNVDNDILASATTQFKETKIATCSMIRVLSTHLKRNSAESEFLYLPGDKLILKATLSLSGYDTVPITSLPTVTSSQMGRDDALKDFKTMFKSGFAHNATFSVGGETIHVHRAVLRSRSPVFAKMFQLHMLESSSKNVVIEDVDFPVFNCFLLFLYTGAVEEKDWEAVVPLYSLGDKYEVESLCRECSRILSDTLTVGSFCTVLELADLHDDEELKETAKIFFRGNFTWVIETSEWAQIVNTKPQLASEVLRSMMNCVPPIPSCLSPRLLYYHSRSPSYASTSS